MLRVLGISYTYAGGGRGPAARRAARDGVGRGAIAELVARHANHARHHVFIRVRWRTRATRIGLHRR